MSTFCEINRTGLHSYFCDSDSSFICIFEELIGPLIFYYGCKNVSLLDAKIFCIHLSYLNEFNKNALNYRLQQKQYRNKLWERRRAGNSGQSSEDILQNDTHA